MSLPKKHFEETFNLLKSIDKSKIASWLLNEGYFPELYVLPPSFHVTDFVFREDPYYSNILKINEKQLERVSYPKTQYTSRIFGIMHPHIYHDIVYYLIDDWEYIIDHIFNENNSIYTYSIPIPVNANCLGELSSLRSGRLIYEWIEMAERDLVAEASKYDLIIRTDITNFYNSIYTHSIAWALHGRKESLQDQKSYKLIGSKLDKLFQYANDKRTNGIPVGPALSDLIAEIILTDIDRKVSVKIKEENIEFVGTRFKDDYRLLVKDETDAATVIKLLTKELDKYNLLISEQKTKILPLPEGLYRHHDREYYPYSLRRAKHISFKTFEFTLLKIIDIHHSFPGTSLIDKFLSELFDQNYNLKLTLSEHHKTTKKQILKLISLLFLLKRESEKTLGYILSVIEAIYKKYNKRYKLKEYIRNIIIYELKNAIGRNSDFEIIWLIFFSRYLRLGIVFKNMIPNIDENSLLKSIHDSKQRFFIDSDVILFKTPQMCTDKTLAQHLAVFHKTDETCKKNP